MPFQCSAVENCTDYANVSIKESCFQYKLLIFIYGSLPSFWFKIFLHRSQIVEQEGWLVNYTLLPILAGVLTLITVWYVIFKRKYSRILDHISFLIFCLAPRLAPKWWNAAWSSPVSSQLFFSLRPLFSPLSMSTSIPLQQVFAYSVRHSRNFPISRYWAQTQKYQLPIIQHYAV